MNKLSVALLAGLVLATASISTALPTMLGTPACAYYDGTSTGSGSNLQAGADTNLNGSCEGNEVIVNQTVNVPVTCIVVGKGTMRVGADSDRDGCEASETLPVPGGDLLGYDCLTVLAGYSRIHYAGVGPNPAATSQGSESRTGIQLASDYDADGVCDDVLLDLSYGGGGGGGGCAEDCTCSYEGDPDCSSGGGGTDPCTSACQNVIDIVQDTLSGCNPDEDPECDNVAYFGGVDPTIPPECLGGAPTGAGGLAATCALVWQYAGAPIKILEDCLAGEDAGKANVCLIVMNLVDECMQMTWDKPCGQDVNIIDPTPFVDCLMTGDGPNGNLVCKVRNQLEPGDINEIICGEDGRNCQAY